MGRLRNRQGQALTQLAALECTLPIVFVALDGRFKPWTRKLRALPLSRVA